MLGSEVTRAALGREISLPKVSVMTSARSVAASIKFYATLSGWPSTASCVSSMYISIELDTGMTKAEAAKRPAVIYFDQGSGATASCYNPSKRQHSLSDHPLLGKVPGEGIASQLQPQDS